jgi:ankyrin repeat protein
MKRTLLSVSFALVAAIPLAAQKDARPSTTMKVPAKTSAVADAAQKGDLALVKKLIAQGADVNIPQGDGMTALHWAADHGDSAMAAALIKARANVKATTRIGNYTPLHVASRDASGGVVRQLIAAGADVKAPTATGATPLHLAAAGGSIAAVNALLEKGADPNAREGEWGQTPLIFAAEHDRPQAITALIKHGADPSIHTKIVDIKEETALEQAATRKRNEVLISYMPKERRDSVMAAAARAQQAAAAQRGAGPDPVPPGPGGGADSAAAAGRQRGGRGGPQPKGPFTPEQIQAAIEAGRKVLNDSSAAKGPVVEQVDTLNGGVAGFGNSVGGMGGLSPLHHAVRQGSIEAVRALLDGGAKIDDTTSVDHTTPLLLATINGQFDVALELIKRGANPNIASTAGMTPLYATINAQWAPKSRYPQPQAVQNQRAPYLEVMAALLDKGANPNVRIVTQPWYFAFNNCGNANCGLENLEGTTAFWRAAYSVDVDAMKLLADHGADVNLPSQRTVVANGRGGGRGGAGGAAGGRGGGGGRGVVAAPTDPQIDSAMKAAPVGLGTYPIHAAAGAGYGNGFAGNSHRHAPDGWLPAMKYLVEVLHADVNARDARGYTPLHHAAARGDNDMINYLVAHGADVRAVSKDGKTTVDMANGPVQRLSPIPETIALLEKLGAKNQHRCVSC